jgi:glycyl-tRNA synthetase
MKNENVITMDDIVKYCQEYGYIYQGSEIYGGLANTWDYGPLGIRLKNNVKEKWRYKFIQNKSNSYELDSDILMNPRVWEASGHVASFSDPLIDCKQCKTRHRVDNLIENFDSTIDVDSMTETEMMDYIKEHNVPCPKCGSHDFTESRNFNLMFETQRGVTNENQNLIYLRPENAQGEYVNYLNVMRSMHAKIPFSIGQIGKAFRNEITPGNFTFRTIEFEQMEYQTFCKPGTDHVLYEYYKLFGKEFFESLGLPLEKLRFKDHEKLAHYAKEACDIEYLFPFGWGEINGTHNRTNFDLSRHQEFSNRKMYYFDQNTNEKYIPYIIESTYGLDRTILALICECLHKYVDDLRFTTHNVQNAGFTLIEYLGSLEFIVKGRKRFGLRCNYKNVFSRRRNMESSSLKRKSELQESNRKCFLAQKNVSADKGSKLKIGRISDCGHILYRLLV